MSAVLQTQTRPQATTPSATAASDGAALNAASLRERFSEARSSGKRAKDAAESLGVSEGEAMAAHAGTHDYPLKATPLQGPWVELLQALQLCGPVMALTRNASTVHEKTGVYENINATGHMGLALGEDIDLRLFFSRWHAGFAVHEPANDAKNPPTQSLQFFDAHGVAVHKVFVRAETDREAFNDIVSQFSAADKNYLFMPAPAKKAAAPDGELDAAGLTQGWSEMTDTHQFFGLISKFGVERQQAFRLVEGRFTERADLGIVRKLLDEAAMDGASIMVFVSSSGCIQIHSGPVKRIEPMVTPTAQWINVLDAGFNLHLREDMIQNAWIVQKPTADGIVTSVDVFDGEGELMAMFFGSRKPGVPEQQAWRDIAARLPRLQA
ncbi:putative hemin transport protein [Polaromonas sp. OV174]|uniref:hemin-degrading factor n=1 Tax=Polaromonas sp. OV174 TaxID=1855300 RepID=UPI0008F0549C|nr:ChuX/HutX family heme-like substrate-binding protein [Polaromonas sp. OV174]SFC74491.1 putative hemin transport protein [Polaromonas sp. OV174]